MKVWKKKPVDETFAETEGARRATGVFPNVAPAAGPPPPTMESATEVVANHKYGISHWLCTFQKSPVGTRMFAIAIARAGAGADSASARGAQRYQTVSTNRRTRMSRSLLTSGTPCCSAVAAMKRSAGSACISNPSASTAISAVSGNACTRGMV